jgi:hypothetical protein
LFTPVNLPCREAVPTARKNPNIDSSLEAYS